MTRAALVHTDIRPLEAADLPAAYAITQGLGWPHRLEDWQFALRMGLGYAAVRDGTLLGTGLGWRFGPHWATLGLVAVEPAAQGGGIGRRLFEAVLDALGDRNVMLHATAAGRPLYEKLGFVPGETICQYQGAPFGVGVTALEPGERLRPIGRSDPALLVALDRAASGMDRATLIEALLEAAPGVVLDRDGEAIGFALLRRFGRGKVIGPVIAPDAGRARTLFGHYLAAREGQFIRVDIPEASGLGPWLEGLGLANAGPVLRMVRGADPVTGPARCFGLVTQAMG